MAQTSTQIEQELNKQQADYLARLEQAGQLPKVINDTVQAADGGQTAELRKQEGDLLKGYVSAAAEQREKYKDVWDPFARDRLAAQGTAQQYSPIADIRQELAMRADALGVATNAALTTWNAGTQKLENAIALTRDAYERAYKREQDAVALQESRANRAASRASAAAKKKEVTPAMVSSASELLQAIPSENSADVAYDSSGKKIGSSDKFLSKNESLNALQQLIGIYGDEDLAYDVFKRAFAAGGFQKYGDYAI